MNLRKWELVFEDDFMGSKLDKEKWMTRYFWGDKLLNDAYALETGQSIPYGRRKILNSAIVR